MSLKQIARELHRQHAVENYIFDFCCAETKFAEELNSFQQGMPAGIQRGAAREKFSVDQGIEDCLLKIWNVVQQKSGCVRIMKNVAERRFVPPEVREIKFAENKTFHAGSFSISRDEGRICP